MANAMANPKPTILYSPAPKATPDGGKQSFPRQGVMIQPTRCSTELNRQSDTGGEAGSQPEEKTEAEAVAEAEDNGVRYRTGKQAQRTVLSTQ